MPLLDHFRPPLSLTRHWESFHTSWADEIMATLNQGVLPAGYFAETQVHFGSRVEIDVAALRQDEAPSQANGGVAVHAFAPSSVLSMPAVFPDEIEIQVYQAAGGATLVGAIELISPRNKDRFEARRTFAAKCLGYLQLGVGLAIVDVVTHRQANLHDEIVELMAQEEEFRFPHAAPLYVVAYRPLRTEAAGDQIEIRPWALAINQALPVIPLTLRTGPTIAIDLEGTYTRTRTRSQL